MSSLDELEQKYVPPQLPEGKIRCITCNRVLKSTNFYQTKNLKRYKDGFVPECKKCLTMTVDNWNPSTFLGILEKIDVPYIPREWDSLLAKYGGNPRLMSGTTIIGRYISKMRLNQNKDYVFKDTMKFVQENSEQKEAFLQQIKSAAQGLAEISSEQVNELENADADDETEQNAMESAQQDENFDWDKLDLSDVTIVPNTVTAGTPTEADTPVGLALENLLDYSSELTLEEQKYLVFKWGKSYSLEDMVKMETLYQETAESFDVSNPNHKDYLKKICKTSLQLDRSLDYGDSDGAGKYARMYDTLNKSAKFTAASNKIEKEEYIGSVGELVAICEKEGFIPRYHDEERKDIVDKTLEDMNRYVERLISNEMNLADLIEASIQMIAAEEAKAKMSEGEELTDEEMLSDNFDIMEDLTEDERKLLEGDD